MSASVAYFVALAKATGFASPASERRDSSPTSTAASSELEQHLNRDTVSPIKHTTERLNEDTLRKPLSTMKLYKVTGNKISKGKGPNRKQKRKSVWDFSRLSSFFSKEQDEEKEEQSKDDLEGDTMVDCDNPMPTTEDDNDRTMVEEDDGFKPEKGSKKQKKIQPIQKEHNNRYLDYNDPRLMDWSRDEIWLFNKFARRGAEPLLPQSWTLDFPTFPDILFTNDPDRVFMNKHHGSEYNHIRALTRLISAGPYCRGNLGSGHPERPLLREITYYYKWSLIDSKVRWKAHIPVIAIASAKPQESIHSVVNRLTKQLHSLGHQYREKWRHPDCREGDCNEKFVHELPTLYGFMIKNTIVAIVTCDASVPDKPIRTLLTTHWGTTGQEVWHALAAAITMVKARNYLMQLDEEGELGPEIIDYGSDPDA